MDKEVDKTPNTDLDRRNISKQNKTYIKTKMYLTDMRAVRALGQIKVNPRKIRGSHFPRRWQGHTFLLVCAVTTLAGAHVTKRPKILQ